jgi:hypothetical protein
MIDRLSLSQIFGVVTRGARNAFLSGCSTAEVWAGRLAEDGLHLVSTFQVVGFAHIVGANDDVRSISSTIPLVNPKA